MAERAGPIFGIKTSQYQTRYEDIARVWRAADEGPFHSAWLNDHLYSLGPDPAAPCLEAWTLLAALAAQTRRLRLGIMLSSNTFRHPAVLAKMAVTVDIVSQGRLDVGLGAGWFEMEHRALGIALPPVGERMRRLGEAIRVLKALWTQPRATFRGDYYRLEGAICEPKPIQRPHPPIAVGGSGEKVTLRLAAEHAAIWNVPLPSDGLDGLRRKIDLLDERCRAIGRDPSEVARSIQLPADPDDPRLVPALRDYLAIGINYVILMLPWPYREETLHRLSEEVVPRVLAD
jgi:F420-dependent oxidoreductase-like protein